MGEWYISTHFLRGCSRKMFASLILLSGAMAIIVRAAFVVTGALIGSLSSVTRGNWSSVFPYVVVLGVAWVLSSTLSQLLHVVQRDYQDRVRAAVNSNLVSSSFSVDLSVVESADFAGKVQMARGLITGVPAENAVLGLSGLANWLIGWLAAAVLLGHFIWWLPVVPTLGMLVQFRWFNKFWDQQRELFGVPGEEIRRSRYLRSLAMAPEFAKELRLFGFGAWVTDRAAELAREGLRQVWGRRWKMNADAWRSIAVTVFAQGSTMLVVARALATGSESLGAATVYLQAALALGFTAGTAFRNWRFGGSAISVLVRLSPAAAEASFSDRLSVPVSDPMTPKGEVPARDHIQLRGVKFAYPSAPDHLVLDSLNLVIPRGRSTAIVGVNGAGKTTVIKLLSGLYSPDEGQVLISGNKVDRSTLQRSVAVVFQDFAHIQSSLLRNITLGADDAVNESLFREVVDITQLASAIEKLPSGRDTTLSPEHVGGTDLSGGQWQRVAIARGLYLAATRELLVLDEPTANLDVKAEAEIFNRLIKARRNQTTILVSHRFPTVRRADQIVVLSEGRVVEQGSHAELLEVGGEYARLYHLQANRFQSKAHVDSLVEAD